MSSQRLCHKRVKPPTLDDKLLVEQRQEIRRQWLEQDRQWQKARRTGLVGPRVYLALGQLSTVGDVETVVATHETADASQLLVR